MKITTKTLYFNNKPVRDRSSSNKALQSGLIQGVRSSSVFVCSSVNSKREISNPKNSQQEALKKISKLKEKKKYYPFSKSSGSMIRVFPKEGIDNNRIKNQNRTDIDLKVSFIKKDNCAESQFAQFTFDIEEYRRRSEKVKGGQPKLKQVFEERRKSYTAPKKPQKRRKKQNIIANWRTFPILEHMVENSIVQFVKYDLLEGSASISEKLVKELSKVEKDADKITALLDNITGFRKFMTTMGVQRKTVYQASTHLGIKYIRAGSYVFKQGDSSDFFYCIIIGKVELSKLKRIEVQQQKEVSFSHKNIRRLTGIKKEVLYQEFDDPFTTLVEGNVFGEYGLIDKDNSQRKASAKAVIDTYLLTVDVDCFKAYFKSCVEKVIFDRKIFLLNHIPCFSSFKKEEFDKLFYKIVISPYRNGQTIINEGETADKIFILMKGSSCKLLKQHKGEAIHILNMQSGDIFGLEAVCQKNIDEARKVVQSTASGIADLVIDNDKLTNYTHSVVSSSDDTSVIKLDMFKSTVTIKSDFIVFLQQIFSSQSSSISQIYYKNIGVRAKFKVNYIKDELDRKINPQLISKFLEANIKNVDLIRKSCHKRNLRELPAISYEVKAMGNTLSSLNISGYNQPSAASSEKIFNTISCADDFNRNLSKANKLLSINQIKKDSQMRNRNNCSILKTEYTSSKKLSTKSPKSLFSTVFSNDKKKVLLKPKLNTSEGNRLINGETLPPKSKIEVFVTSPQNLKLFRTENFNIPLISQLMTK